MAKHPDALTTRRAYSWCPRFDRFADDMPRRVRYPTYMHVLRTVDLAFVDDAPHRLVEDILIEASAERVFEVFEDGRSWPEWFPGMTGVTWTTPEPRGVGATRTVELGKVRVDEVFLAWEPGRRFAFYLRASTSRLLVALAEDYRLEPLDERRCRFTYALAYEPAWLVRPLDPVVRWQLRKMLRGACRGLAAYMRGASGGA